MSARRRLLAGAVGRFALPLGLALLAVRTAAIAQPATQVPSGAGTGIRLVEIRGTINPASANHLRASIDRARAEKAQAVLVELDTPGGLVSSVRDMAQAIDDSPVPVIVFTTPAGASATSAGALLMLASHVAAMSPGTAMGAAHPVDSSGNDIQGAMKEKALNDTAAFARGLAEVRGRNRDLAEKVVTRSLSLTAHEAAEKGVIEILARDRDDLLRILDGREIALRPGGAGGAAPVKVRLRTAGAPVFRSEMTIGQKLLDFLANPTIAALLMSLGVLAIYVELSTAGVGFAGVLGVMCLLVAFMSFQMLPIRMGGLLLMVTGLAFLVAEAFVTTKGALALGGTLSFVLGLLWVMDPAQTSLRVSPAVWLPLAATLLGGALGLGWLVRRMRSQVEGALARIGGAAASGLSGYAGHVTAVAADGRTGKIQVRGEVWDFESDEELRVGQQVAVLRMDGMRAVVRKA